MLTSRNPDGKIEAYTDIGQFVGILPPDHPLAKKFAEDGGPGSGNFGHRGRPGKVGGSQKGGGSQYRGGRSDIGYFGSRKDWMNGLQGEKQHEAVRFIAQKKSDIQDKLDRKEKVENLYKQGLLTVSEAEERIREMGAEGLTKETSPEEYVMKNGSFEDKSKLVALAYQARNWEKNAEKLKNENLSEDERKVFDYMEKNIASISEADMEVYLDLKAKAMALPFSGKEIPDEIQYEAGTKERPKAPQNPAPEIKQENFPGFMKKKQTKAFADYINSVNDRDPDIAEIYTHISENAANRIPSGVKNGVQYTDTGHWFRTSIYVLSGKIAEAKLKIPKMADPEYAESEAATTAHEVAHFIDFLCREDINKSGDLSNTYASKFGALRQKNSQTSKDVSDHFDDVEKKCSENDKKLVDEYKKLESDYNNKIKKAYINRNYSEALRLQRARDNAYNEMKANLDRQGRQIAGGAGALMDIYQALGDRRRRFGHDYKDDASRMSECWANWCELSLAYPNERKILEREKPEFCELMKEMTKEIIGRMKNANGTT